LQNEVTHPTRDRGLGSAVSSPSEVWGYSPDHQHIFMHFELQNASHGNNLSHLRAKVQSKWLHQVCLVHWAKWW